MALSIFNLAEAGSIEGVTELLDKATDKKELVNLKDTSQMTALMWCAKGGSLEMMKLLHQNGAYPNERTGQGSTACHVAARKGHLNLVKYLVESMGAETDIRTLQGQTAADWASNDEIKEYLKSKM